MYEFDGSLIDEHILNPKTTFINQYVKTEFTVLIAISEFLKTK